MVRVCVTAGCPNLVKAKASRGRCDTCRVDRGYGGAHQAARKAVQDRINAGEQVTCWRCSTVLEGRAWHLDHDDDRAEYRGPACIPCNLELAGKRSQSRPNW